MEKKSKMKGTQTLRSKYHTYVRVSSRASWTIATAGERGLTEQPSQRNIFFCSAIEWQLDGQQEMAVALNNEPRDREQPLDRNRTRSQSYGHESALGYTGVKYCYSGTQ